MEARTASSASSTQPVRRSSTLPVRLQDTSERRASTPRAAPGVETLYIHPSAKIISFSTSNRSIRPSTSNGRAAIVEESPGTLPWNTRIERTLAVGSLKVYRAPGSVAFINCGNALQPILPKSQCWCVDDTRSKFALQIHRPQYWRIELPHTELDDLRRLEEFRDVLNRILLYEKTPCPFRRTFTVQLPEPPQEPINYRPWKPVTKAIDEVPRAKLSKVSTPKSLPPTEADSADEYYSAVSDDDVENTPEAVEDEYSDTTEDDNVTPTNAFPHSYFDPDLDLRKAPPKPEILKKGHSLTASPKLTVVASPPSKQIKKPFSRQSTLNIGRDSTAILPPSPPESNTDSPRCKRIPSPTVLDCDISSWGLPRTPSIQSIDMELSESNPETLNTSVKGGSKPKPNMLQISTAENRTTRSRAKTDSGPRARNYSPLPPAANIHSPTEYKPRRLQTRSHIPTAIIQKTCEILLSPPSHLIQLMVNIASRITAGEWRGIMFGFNEGGEEIVGQWDYSDGDPLDTWGEDDYGVSLGGAASMRRRPMPGGFESWDSD